LHAAVLYPDAVAGMFLAEPRLPEARTGAAAGVRSGLTTRRILLIEQPVVATCGPRSPALPLCRFLADHLPRCKAAPAPEDAAGFVADIQRHLRDMAGTFLGIEEMATMPTSQTGPHAQAWPDAGNGRAVARWVARLSAWGS
jgi:hypothetical protein